MVVCRTLDYIVNPELHKFLLSKFNDAKRIGIEIEIELTEHIIDLFMDYKDLSNIIGSVLENAYKTLAELREKKLVFCMFYKGNNLHIIIQHHIDTKDDPYIFAKNLIRKTENALNKYTNVCWNASWENYTVELELIISKE